MTKKSLLPTIFACVAMGGTTILFDLWTDREPHPTPPRAQHHATAPRDRTAQREQRTGPGLKNRTQGMSTPKAHTVIGERSHPPRPPEGFHLEARRGVVTLRADNHSLKQVLAALAQESGIQINTHLIADRPLSIALAGVPLDHALQTILEFEDSFFAFETRGQANAALKAVWVVPAGTGGTWRPQTAACARDLLDLEQQLTAAHASQRAEALDTMIDLLGPDAAPAVVQSLGDHEDDVRYRALLKAQVAGLVLPPEVLTDRVQQDGSALVRMMALEAIGNHPSIAEHDKLAVAQSAIDDVSPAVQTRAGELLSHLEAAPRIREQEQALYDEAEQAIAEEFPDENISEQDK
jgi:hypothetical protein